MKVRKPKQRKARGHEVLPSVSRASFVPPSEPGEPSFYHEFETTEEDWEDLESAYTHDTLDDELDWDLKPLRMARDDSASCASSPSTPRRGHSTARPSSTEGDVRTNVKIEDVHPACSYRLVVVVVYSLAVRLRSSSKILFLVT
ncbi:hypothetical protein BJ322DRAFT_1106704 [Thelephora terrestris]|uniref:Uncharacterized protein n=1 Tax=Thelephora terrestris TaxID=56493 RepID=A0A9P6L9R0_9AGAM|nr:hypothetical protein BJ322DRAFT_1106704 [Thelephora terrestris]